MFVLEKHIEKKVQVTALIGVWVPGLNFWIVDAV